MTLQWLSSFLMVFSTLTLTHSQEEAWRASITGNITLGGLFPVHFPGKQGPCSNFNSLRAMQEIEALLYSVDKINADDKLLPNITLGVKAFDTCGDATSALNSAVKEFVLGNSWNTNEQCNEHEYPVAAVIGPGYSYEAVHITPFLNLFEIPLISYSATSAELSDKSKYEYFSRTATSDDHQIPAIIELLVYFNWTYVSILYTDESYGTGGYNGLKAEADLRGIFFANNIKSVPQKYDERKFKEAVDDVLSRPKASVIILFGVESAMEPLLYMIQKHAGNRSLQFVASDSLASAINEELGKVQRITQQAFFFNLPTRQMNEFTKYFLKLSVQDNERNPWFKDFFSSLVNCTFDDGINEKPKCKKTQTLANTKFANDVRDFTQSVPLVVDAVYAFAHAINHLIEECQKNGSQPCVPFNRIHGQQLLKVLRKQVFQSPSGSNVTFTKDGDVIGAFDIYFHGNVDGKKFEYFKVGQWSGHAKKLRFHDLQWKKMFTPVISTCKTVCKANQRRKSSTKPRYCWKCEDCKPGSYAVNETSCKECPKGEKPNIQLKSCEEIIPKYLTVDGKVAPVYVVVLPLVFASTGFLAVLIVFGIFVKYWNTPLVKASGRELSSLLLLGILLAFLFSFVAIARPSPAKCFWQFVLASLPATVCFVAIAVKNNRTFRIFNPNRVLTAQPSLIRPKSQILVSLGLITFQLILLAALVTLNFPRDEFIYPDFETINYVCIISETQLLLSHVYNVMLLVACTYYGYKTKNIPRNFNEAKHIAFAMYGACVSMVTFGVIFLLNSQFSTDYGVVIEMMHTNLLGFIIVVCFFAPKVYIILYKPQENQNNTNIAGNSVIATEFDVVKTREHRRSQFSNQFPAHDDGFKEFNIGKVEPADTNPE